MPLPPVFRPPVLRSPVLRLKGLCGLAAAACMCAMVVLPGSSAFSQDANSNSVPDPMAQSPALVSPMGQGFAPLNPMAVTPAGPQTSSVPLNAEFGNLPDAPGMEDTYYSCTACHSAATFAQQRLTDERWEYLWDWMISDQGMADYGDEAREIILAYLQTHFSSER